MFMGNFIVEGSIYVKGTNNMLHWKSDQKVRGTHKMESLTLFGVNQERLTEVSQKLKGNYFLDS